MKNASLRPARARSLHPGGDTIEGVLVSAPLSVVAAIALARLEAAVEPADEVLSYLEPLRDPSGNVVGFVTIPCAA